MTFDYATIMGRLQQAANDSVLKSLSICPVLVIDRSQQVSFVIRNPESGRVNLGKVPREWCDSSRDAALFQFVAHAPLRSARPRSGLQGWKDRHGARWRLLLECFTRREWCYNPNASIREIAQGAGLGVQELRAGLAHISVIYGRRISYELVVAYGLARLAVIGSTSGKSVGFPTDNVAEYGHLARPERIF